MPYLTVSQCMEVDHGILLSPTAMRRNNSRTLFFGPSSRLSQVHRDVASMPHQGRVPVPQGSDPITLMEEVDFLFNFLSGLAIFNHMGSPERRNEQDYP